MRDTRAIIRKAFQGVSPPIGQGAFTLHSCPECDELENQLNGHEWEAVPSEIIDYQKDTLSLLSPKALHYYLPAWLLRALDDPSGDVMEFVIFHLAPSKKTISESFPYFESRFSLFSVEQKQAILAFFADVEEYQLWQGYEGEIERANELWSTTDQHGSQ